MSTGDQIIYLDAPGIRRRYVLHRPTVVHQGTPLPAVIMLDGRGGTPWTAMKSTGWSALADDEGFLVAYPEATRIDPHGPLHFLTNPQMWNAGSGGSDAERSHVDDVGFLNLLLDDLIQRGADPARLYMCGFSNGASMTFRFASEIPERLAALGTVAGHFRQNQAGHPTRPIPLAHYFGMQDPISPFHGGLVKLPWGPTELRPPARDSAVSWANRNGWSHPPTHEAGEGYYRERWGEPGHPAEVVFTAIEDLGHVWPGGHRLLPEALVGRPSDRLSATRELWAFFSRHSL
ncbi:MAG: hypothetical protein NZ740_08850 [Kiritimatiellae bacterium]|nr:hypothetical protein [Kiritimatiellia bacterium]MDW8459200.1 PHB depolymerase family esterase [Verrucomicrobiota bacterium]